MSAFSAFMKANKKTKPNAFYPATKSLCDEKGEPLLWEVRALTTRESEAIRVACTIDEPIPGKKNQFRQKVSGKYTARLMAAAVVSPDLNDADLQDSYGVNKPEDLLCEMIDNPAEYADFMEFIQKHSGFDVSASDEVEEAKN